MGRIAADYVARLEAERDAARARLAAVRESLEAHRDKLRRVKAGRFPWLSADAELARLDQPEPESASEAGSGKSLPVYHEALGWVRESGPAAPADEGVESLARLVCDALTATWTEHASRGDQPTKHERDQHGFCSPCWHTALVLRQRGVVTLTALDTIEMPLSWNASTWNASTHPVSEAKARGIEQAKRGEGRELADEELAPAVPPPLTSQDREDVKLVAFYARGTAGLTIKKLLARHDALEAEVERLRAFREKALDETLRSPPRVEPEGQDE